MFNKQLFKAECVAHQKTLAEAAAVLGISPVTLNRKMKGESDFTRNEIQLFRSWLNLGAEETDRIFFANELAFS